MVSVYFGLPGCGKSTLLTKIALKESKKKKPFKRYDYIYTNYECFVPGVIPINNNVIGHYELAPDNSSALVLIDEGTLFADSRDYSNFDYERLMFFILHRHYRCDVIITTQYFDGIDKRIRLIIDRAYYLYKGIITRHWFSQYYRIPYTILIPKKDTDNTHIGEIVQGYYKPNIIGRILTHRWIFRPKYYKYFDSFSKIELPPLPANYQFDIKQQFYSPVELAKKELKEKKKFDKLAKNAGIETLR